MISVIVPIYNTEKYLRECLDSLRAQTYTDIEVVMVNDGSTDSSPAIAAEYARRDSRFKLINKENGGQSSARNLGIDNAVGDLFFFLDSDDALHPQSLELLSNALKDYPEVDMAMADLKWSDRPRYRITNKYEIRDGADLLVDTLYQKKGTHNSPCVRLIKKKVLKQAGYFRDGIVYEDLDYSFALYQSCGKIAVSNDIIHFYRKTPGSTTRIWKPKRLDVLDVVDDIVARAKGHGTDLEKAARSRRFSAYYNMFLLSTANGCKEGADRCWLVIRKLRLSMLLDPHVRFKNKAGALISYLGRRFTSLFA